MSLRTDVKSDKPRKKTAKDRLDEKRSDERKERDSKRVTLQEELPEARQEERREITTKTLYAEKELKQDDVLEIAERMIHDESVLRRPLTDREVLIHSRMGMYRLAVRLVSEVDWDFNVACKWADDMGGKESTILLVREAKAYLEKNPTKKGRYQ